MQENRKKKIKNPRYVKATRNTGKQEGKPFGKEIESLKFKFSIFQKISVQY